MKIEQIIRLKMKPLMTNRQMLTWLGFYPVDENTSKREGFGYVIFGVVVFAMIVCTCAASIAYFQKISAINLGEALYAVLQVIGTLHIMYLMVFTFLQRHKIVAIFEKLSEIYSERKKK